MIIDFKLTYPSGTATAHLINSFHTPQGAKLAKLVGFSYSVSYIFITLERLPNVFRVVQETSKNFGEVLLLQLPLGFLPVVFHCSGWLRIREFPYIWP